MHATTPLLESDTPDVELHAWAADKWQAARRNRFSAALHERLSRRSLLAIGLSALVALLLSSSILPLKLELPTQRLKSSGALTVLCDDEWRLPGFTWYGNTTQEVQYIPYSKLDDLLDPHAVEYFNPESHLRASVAAPPSLLQPGPSLSQMLLNADTRSRHLKELEFLRDKHFVSIGSSLDMVATKAFCTQHNASFAKHNHADGHCHFAELNFTFSTWMHFGLHQTDWFHGYDFPNQGTTLEDRIDIKFKPLAQVFGKPTLILFTSSLWDIQYLQATDRKNNEDLAQFPEMSFFPVSWDQLKWHRGRLVQALNFIRSSFPGAVVMYRTAPDVRPRTPEDQESLSVFELNQSSRAVMKQLGVPLFNWSDLVRGLDERKDVLHYNVDSHANWLYGEMVLSTLKHIVLKTQDPQCWVDR